VTTILDSVKVSVIIFRDDDWQKKESFPQTAQTKFEKGPGFRSRFRENESPFCSPSQSGGRVGKLER
jgi:hypothetical protein